MEINRRDFSKTMAMATAVAMLDAKSLFAAGPAAAAADHANLTIDRIEIFPVRYPMVMRFKFFEAPVGLSGRPAVIIKITASDGTVGWGESVPIPRWSGETLEGAVSTLKNYIIPILVGRNALDIAGAHQIMNAELADGFATSHPITKSGIDIALHDLMGKVLKKSLPELWGRTAPDDLVLSWTLNPLKLDDIPGIIEKGRARGYENFNVKVAPNKQFDIDMSRMVKSMVPDGFLWADANGGYDVDTALEMAPKLADAGVAVLEGPLHPNQLSGYQRLVKQGALPILMDEGCVSPVEVEEFIKFKCIDGVAMKPSRCGGLVSAVAQLKLLEKYDLMFLGSGLTDPDISLAATLALYGAFGLKKPAALNGPQFLGESVLKDPFKVVGGKVKIPKGHGLGIEVDEDKVRDLSARTGKV